MAGQRIGYLRVSTLDQNDKRGAGLIATELNATFGSEPTKSVGENCRLLSTPKVDASSDENHLNENEALARLYSRCYACLVRD